MGDRTSVSGGQGTETEGVVDRVLKAWAGMKGGGGSRGHRVEGGRGTGLVPEGGRVGVRGLVTDT